MFHLVWEDYDGPRVERFQDQKVLQDRIYFLKTKDVETYGFKIILIIKDGKEMKEVPVEVTTKYSVEEKKEEQ